MWTSLFAVTAAIAVALTMAAIVVDSSQWRQVPPVTAFCLKRQTWAAPGPPIFIAGGVLPRAETLQY